MWCQQLGDAVSVLWRIVIEKSIQGSTKPALVRTSDHCVYDNGKRDGDGRA
ncbi:hypothetical protein RGE_06910 [Rubrivivax gelatinosus IL144]|uniref:Uncharacterized protein n=1 Tax=Rubrivivax gelatinosus (strain NBRC 100245 / IL144) TaxID=983917 RepID=I0HLZ9_RUBGI|nr:hypothetical protein RGE_06910 [Rubrivivax gelatinosus IL144]